MNTVILQLIFALFSFNLCVAQNNCSVWGTDSIKTLHARSLWTEFFKQGNYDDAYVSWQYVFENAPGATRNTYIEGVKLLKKMIEKDTNAARREILIDTMLLVYDQRIKCFGDEGNVLARKAPDLLKYRPKNIKEVLALFEKSVDLTAAKTDTTVYLNYFTTVAFSYRNNHIDKEGVLNIYQKLTGFADANISKGTNAQKYAEIQNGLAAILGDLKLITNCTEAKAVYEKKYKENPEDLALMKKMAELLKSAGCIEDPMFIEVSEKLNVKEPSSTSAYFLAKAKYVQGKIQDCLKYFTQAIEMETDSMKKADYLLDMAGVYSSKTDDYATARAKAKAAAALRPKWGEPYLFIGDLYASSGKKCGPGTGFESQVITWVAVDMYQKAKSVDPNFAEKANAQIAKYAQYFPSKEDIFFRELKEGDSFKVECWINEMTTVRTKKE